MIVYYFLVASREGKMIGLNWSTIFMSNTIYPKSYTYRYKSPRIHFGAKPNSRYSPLMYLAC